MKSCLRLFRPLVMVAVLSLIVACGQTGPLYLPDISSDQAKQVEPDQNKQVQDEQEKKDKDSE